MLRRLRDRMVSAGLSKRGGSLAGGLSWVLLALSGTVLWMTALRDMWPLLDVVSPLAVHALAIAIVASGTLLLKRGRLLFLAGSLGAMLLVPTLLTLDARERPGMSPAIWHHAVASPGLIQPALKVLSINTFHNNQAPEKLWRYLARADADVVVLSEFGPSKSALLERLKRAYPYQVSCADRWPCAQVLLSRQRFERSGFVMPSLKSPPLVWAEFRSAGVKGSKVTVIGTHIYRPSRRFDWHRAQLAGLAERLRRMDGGVIIAGDFNMTRLSASFEDFLAESGLVAGDRELPGWPAWPSVMPLPQVQIDHLFVSRDLAVVDQRIGTPVGSDHLPLWSAVRLPDKATIMAGRSGRAVHGIMQ